MGVPRVNQQTEEKQRADAEHMALIAKRKRDKRDSDNESVGILPAKKRGKKKPAGK